MNTLNDYLKKLQQEISTRALSSENGGAKEQIFTRIAIDILKQNGEAENVSVSYDEKSAKKVLPHKINAFSISDDLQTIDLYITKFFPSAELKGFQEEEVKELIALVSNFYKKAFEDNYAVTIAESSEIFECANEIGHNEEFRSNISQIRVTVLSNGICDADVPGDDYLCGTPVSYRLFGLHELYSRSEEAVAPVDVDITKRGFKVPCVAGDDSNDVYQVYLAIIPGKLLADLYDDYGVRLMENNVRQFLQFTGKVNKGIKETIEQHPEMFLAYNNGIAATASKITLDETGRFITSASDLQIVNGGQTTASLYHARKQNPNVNLNRIAVQAKISVIKNTDQYKSVVNTISRCANSQNRVGVADFSANDERLVRLEKMSRYLMAPESSIHPHPTYWYFERYKAQYKNFRIRDGFTKQREKQFDLKYPSDQKFDKFDTAKFINAYDIVRREGHVVAGPHIVCQGNEKCYDAFIRNNLPAAAEIDNIYFEDLVAKAIIFKDAERRYGTKTTGNYIGDIRKTVVPYAIALLVHLTKNKIDLYKIWNNQALSNELSDLLYSIMKELNSFIIKNTPMTRVEEWGKKEDCWNTILEHEWSFNLKDIKADLVDPSSKTTRKSIVLTDDEKLDAQIDRDRILDIPSEIWDKAAVWGKESEMLNLMQQIAAKEIARKMREDIELDDNDIAKALIIEDALIKNNIDLLYQANAFTEETEVQTPSSQKRISLSQIKSVLDLSTIRRMLEWDKTRHVMKSHVREACEKAVRYREDLSFRMYYAAWYDLQKMEARGFKR